MGDAIRFTGLSSGLDTQSVVEALLKSYQAKIDKQKANKQKAEWKQDIYKDLNTKLKDFKNSLKELKNPTSLCAANATTSREGVVSIKSAQYKGNENHTILVKQVAERASVKTKAMGTYSATEADGRIVDKKVTADTNLNDIFTDDATRKATIKIGNATVKLEECTKISDIVKAVQNQDSSINIAFNDSISAFTISSKETGKDQSIILSRSDEAGLRVFNTLGIGSMSSYSHTIEYKGKDAEIVYDNALSFTSKTNDIEINGLSFTAQSASTEPVTVSVSQDTSETFDKVKKFIDTYNKLLGEIADKYYAGSASKYDVLTEEKKEAMTDKEVELWNDKIKNSLMRRDTSLEALYSQMRSVMTADYSEPENGGLDKEYSLLAQIGIASSNWKDQGKLTIDEGKLKDLLAKDGDKVSQLISKVAGALEKKLNDLSSLTNDDRTYGSFFNDKLLKRQIKDFDDAADAAQDKYDRMETYYYKKFTAMEKAMQNLNSTNSLFANL